MCALGQLVFCNSAIQIYGLEDFWTQGVANPVQPTVEIHLDHAPECVHRRTRLSPVSTKNTKTGLLCPMAEAPGPFFRDEPPSQ